MEASSQGSGNLPGAAPASPPPGTFQGGLCEQPAAPLPHLGTGGPGLCPLPHLEAPGDRGAGRGRGAVLQHGTRQRPAGPRRWTRAAAPHEDGWETLARGSVCGPFLIGCAMPRQLGHGSEVHSVISTEQSAALGPVQASSQRPLPCLPRAHTACTQGRVTGLAVTSDQ